MGDIEICEEGIARQQAGRGSGPDGSFSPGAKGRYGIGAGGSKKGATRQKLLENRKALKPLLST